MGKAGFSDDFKRDAVLQITERGHPVTEVSQRLGVSPHALYEWKKRYSQPSDAGGGDQAAEIRQLKRELARVTEEGGIHANPYIIDAIIGFSVVYKAFDNMDGFKRFLGFQPNTKLAVLVFGFFHGFGLATKLQDFSLGEDGLVVDILSFNIGVEIGQVLALTAVLILLSLWRTLQSYLRYAFAINTVLIGCGFLLVGYQLSGYFLAAG